MSCHDETPLHEGSNHDYVTDEAVILHDIRSLLRAILGQLHTCVRYAAQSVGHFRGVRRTGRQANTYEVDMAPLVELWRLHIRGADSCLGGDHGRLRCGQGCPGF